MLVLLAAALASEDPAIEVHLLDVADTLRAETPADLDPVVRARRLDLLDALRTYALAGDYPEHRGPVPPPHRTSAPRTFDAGDGSTRRPRFVDDEGTHCAVGWLVALSDPALALAIDHADPYGYVTEIASPALDAWATTNGFTRDELAWIQPNYETYVVGCAEPDVREVAPPARTPCEGYDLALFGDWRDTLCTDDCGTSLRVLARVANLGTTASAAGTLRTVQGASSFVVPALAPGATTTIVLPWTTDVWSGLTVDGPDDCHPEAGPWTPDPLDGNGPFAILDADGDGAGAVRCGGLDCDDHIARQNDQPDCWSGTDVDDGCDAACPTYRCMVRASSWFMRAPTPQELATCLEGGPFDTGDVDVVDTDETDAVDDTDDTDVTDEGADTPHDGPSRGLPTACGCDTRGPAPGLVLPLVLLVRRRRR